MNIKNFILLLIVSMSILACTSPVNEVDLLNLDTEFEISLSQRFSQKGGVPLLQIKTVKDLNCSNSDINIMERFGSLNNQITIQGVQLESACNNVAGRIEKMVDLQTDKERTDIEINIGEIAQNDGVLISNDTHFELDMESYHGIQVVGSSVKKLHEPIIWGTFNQNSQVLYDDFYAFLEAESPIHEIEDGDYGVFKIRENGEISLSEAKNENHKSFYIPIAITMDKVQQIISRVEAKHNLPFDILVQNHLGESI